MKTSAHQIAARYVKALFMIAKSETARAGVEKDFAALEAALEASAELRNMLSSPLLTRAQQEQALVAVLDRMKAHKETKQFIALLARQKRLKVLPQIIRLFKEQASAMRGEMAAEVVSAQTLGKSDIDAIARQLAKAYGKDIDLSAREDESLLGGIVVRVGSLMLDGSLSGQLKRLERALKAA